MRRGLIAAGAALALTVTACSGEQPVVHPITGPPPLSVPPATTAQAAPTPTKPSMKPTKPRTVAAPDPCAGNTKAKAVLVRLSVQHLWLCEKSTLVRDSAITSGMKGRYTETPTGRYEIQSRTRNTTLTLKSGKTYAVKYWIPFDGPLFGFHDSSWQDFAYGSAKYETDGSHGCVHLPLSTIRFLYTWADIGTSVRIKA